MSKSKFDKHSNELVFKFSNKEAANHFKTWLCEQGEQDYWMWMEYCEQESSSKEMTVLEFDYHTGTSDITTKCGRLDKR